MMETAEISAHLYRVFVFVRTAERWVTAREIAAGAQVARRTARAHAVRLVSSGLFDQAQVWPGHRYRMALTAAKRNPGFLRRLEDATVHFMNTGG